MVKRYSPKLRRHRKKADPRWSKFFADDPQLAQKEREAREEQRRQDIQEMSLADTGLSIRVVNTLESMDIREVGQLAEQTRDDLMGIENFGESTLVECRNVMDDLGVKHSSWKRPPRRKRKSKKKKVVLRAPAQTFLVEEVQGTRWKLKKRSAKKIPFTGALRKVRVRGGTGGLQRSVPGRRPA